TPRVSNVNDLSQPSYCRAGPYYSLDFRKARKARNPTRLDPQKGRVSGLFLKLAAGFGL
ncbi:hypothetical protein PENSOL_c220G04493, partial [Penicillium solitum]